MYVIGDVHGCKKTLVALLEQLPPDEPKVFTGDLIDRGPDSAGVVELVMSAGYQCVLGNHELFMLSVVVGGKFSSGGYERNTWMANGGDATLKSYGNDIPAEHVEWISERPIMLEFPEVLNDDGRKLVVSHSAYHQAYHKFNLDPEHNLWSRDSILWNRLSVYKSTDRYFVHGHTVRDAPDVQSWYANIDTGCVFNGAKAWDTKKGVFVPFEGKLTALKYPEMTVVQQPCIDEVLKDED